MKKRFKKILRFFRKRLSFTKREKFGVVVGLLTLGLLAVQLAASSFRYQLIIVLVVLTYLLSAWSLREDLAGVEWLTLFILPAMYTAAINLFYFLLPVRWLTRLPTAFLFAVGMYAILLVENIYNVAAERTIQLLRAAHSVGLLITLFTLFLFFSVVFSLHLPAYWNVLLVFLISLPLSLQSLWSMRLDPRIDGEILIFTFLTSLSFAEFAFVFSFWPIQGVIEALFLTTIYYTIVGLVQQNLVERLFRQTITEFVSVAGVVFVLVLITTSWG